MTPQLRHRKKIHQGVSDTIPFGENIMVGNTKGPNNMHFVTLFSLPRAWPCLGHFLLYSSPFHAGMGSEEENHVNKKQQHLLCGRISHQGWPSGLPCREINTKAWRWWEHGSSENTERESVQCGACRLSVLRAQPGACPHHQPVGTWLCMMWTCPGWFLALAK